MCSNDELRRSNDALAKALRENTREQVNTRLEMASMKATWEVWRKTRCVDNLQRLEVAETRIGVIEGSINKIIGKTAGAVGSITLIACLLSLLIGYAALNNERPDNHGIQNGTNSGGMGGTSEPQPDPGLGDVVHRSDEH